MFLVVVVAVPTTDVAFADDTAAVVVAVATGVVAVASGDVAIVTAIVATAFEKKQKHHQKC